MGSCRSHLSNTITTPNNLEDPDMFYIGNYGPYYKHIGNDGPCYKVSYGDDETIQDRDQSISDVTCEKNN